MRDADGRHTEPALFDDEDSELAYLYGFPVGTPEQAKAQMVRLAHPTWGLWIEVTSEPKLRYYREAEEGEDGYGELEVVCEPDDPRGQPVWCAYFEETDPPPAGEEPGPTYGEIHPDQIALVPAETLTDCGGEA